MWKKLFHSSSEAKSKTERYHECDEVAGTCLMLVLLNFWGVLEVLNFARISMSSKIVILVEVFVKISRNIWKKTKNTTQMPRSGFHCEKKCWEEFNFRQSLYFTGLWERRVHKRQVKERTKITRTFERVKRLNGKFIFKNSLTWMRKNAANHAISSVNSSSFLMTQKEIFHELL